VWSFVNIAIGCGLAIAIVLGLWLLASVADDAQREVRRGRR
jgi:hypothetical protein